MSKKKNKKMNPAQLEAIRTKDFFDCILPGSVRFMSDYYIVGDSYRSVWVVREYPPSTEEQAILSQLADRSGVTLRIYHRLVEPMEQRKILQNATRKNKLMSGGNDVNETIEAQGNLQDVVELLANLRKNKEPLLHCSVFIELKARNLDKLKELQSEISMELTRSKISVDRLTLRQKEGFLSVLPVGANQFGAQYERVLPASSVANLYPFNFSGKTDPHGLYIGRDKYGSNVLVDFDRRAEDTRAAAAQVIAGHFGTSAIHVGGSYDTYTVRDNDNRQWKVVSDVSIRRESRRGESRNSAYAVEFVSPICKYEDIETIQELIRKLRTAGAKVNDSCGIHVHIDASPHDVKTLRNIVNIMAAKEDLLYKTLKVNVNREHYCAKADIRFLDELNAKRPTSMDTLESIWYNGRSGRNSHYDESRYHGLNLHSVFSKGTIEFRLFNSTLHAGEIKSYIQLCMAISHQALMQKSASRIKTQSSNEKYTFRVWLLRLGLIGDEFKTARHHLLKNLDGNIAWKDPAQAEAQKQRLAEKRLAESVAQAMEQAPVPPILDEDESEEPRMTM